MNQNLYRAHQRKTGFTIIEVMIVLAIAGLIVLVVFLAVPSAQRRARNYAVKVYAGQVYALMDEYYAGHNKYPGAEGIPFSAANVTEICDFIQGLPQVKSGASCNHNTSSYSWLNGPQSADCMDIAAGQYTVCYQDWISVSHAYIGAPGEISVMLGHWCNSGEHIDPDEAPTNPVAGNDILTKRFAVWTQLEGTSIPFCIDNFPS